MSNKEPEWKFAIREQVESMSLDDLMQYIVDLAWAEIAKYGDNRSNYELTCVEETLKSRVADLKDSLDAVSPYH